MLFFVYYVCFASLMSCAYSDYWKPKAGTTLHIQYAGMDKLDLNLKGIDAYNLDWESTDASTISTLHANGKKVICYFSAGSYEDWRKDASSFPKSVLGKDLDGWPGEKWLDISQASILMPIMEKRMDVIKSKGCDAVDPDNVDGYKNPSGFTLTAEDQLNYNKLIAEAAHSRNLSTSLKNDLDQIPDLVDVFDFSVNEQCHEFDECDTLLPFIKQDKPVFVLEYKKTPSQFCQDSNVLGFTAQYKNLSLDFYTFDCLLCYNSTQYSNNKEYCDLSTGGAISVTPTPTTPGAPSQQSTTDGDSYSNSFASPISVTAVFWLAIIMLALN